MSSTLVEPITPRRSRRLQHKPGIVERLKLQRYSINPLENSFNYELLKSNEESPEKSNKSKIKSKTKKQHQVKQVNNLKEDIVKKQVCVADLNGKDRIKMLKSRIGARKRKPVKREDFITGDFDDYHSYTSPFSTNDKDFVAEVVEIDHTETVMGINSEENTNNINLVDINSINSEEIMNNISPTKNVNNDNLKQIASEKLQAETDFTQITYNGIIPRSMGNAKFSKVYKASPTLRSVSPPRFTTVGLAKHRINFEKIGVKRLNKVIGNPYSNFEKRKNHLIFGNSQLSENEVHRYGQLDREIKSMINEQSDGTRKTSYVKAPILNQVKQELGISTRKVNSAEDNVVDIETVDEQTNLNAVTSSRNRFSHRAKAGRRAGRTALQCELCGYQTTHSGHMKVHVVSVHQQQRIYKCQYVGCKYESSRKGTMVRHEKCVHRKDKVYQCPREGCNFSSVWTKSLERHIITVHEALRPWKCNYCPFSAGQKYTLQIHIESLHKKMKSHKCAFCSFGSSTKAIVKSHVLQKHSKLDIEGLQLAQTEQLSNSVD